MAKLLIMMILLHMPSHPPAFREAYDPEYREAVRFLASNSNRLLRECKRFGTDPTILGSIVFPELVRYSLFRDYFEIKADEILYINGGKESADFSIGPFQIKPSFAEQIEKALSIRPDITCSEIFAYACTDSRANRKQRIERLASLDWQFRYVNAFLLLAYEKCKGKSFDSRNDMLHYLATCYNCGLFSDEQKIAHWEVAKAYPFGPGQKGSKYNYADISVEFHNSLFSNLQLALLMKK